MELNIEHRANLSIIKLPEAFTGEFSKFLKAQLIALHNGGTRNIVLDLSKTTSLGPTGLAVVLETTKLCKHSMGYCVLINVKEATLNLIKMSQQLSVVNIKDSLEEAVIFMFND